MLNKIMQMGLQWKILLGIVLGILLGSWVNAVYGPGVEEGFLGFIRLTFGYAGDIFLRLLRMLIIPLVGASIFMAVVNLGDLKELGKIGSKTVVYYFITTALAVLMGLVLVNIVHPGSGMDPESLKALNITTSIPDKVTAQGVGERSTFEIISETFVNMIPTNPIKAMAQGDILQVIFFSLFFGIIATSLQQHTQSLVQVVRSIDRLMNRSIMVVMELAPYCIFFLVTVIFMDLGVAALKALSSYAFTVVLGLLLHAGITLPLLVLLVGRTNPLKLLRAVSPALLTAWSTASSAATLPLTMRCLNERAKVDPKISQFVLPLGATINMDGTALYESVAVLFIAEFMGIDLTLGMQAIIFLTASLAAVGAAAIPGAGLVTMGIVLTAVGLPLEGIGLILAIDRILDQFRTAVNVWGDTTAAVVVAELEKERV